MSPFQGWVEWIRCGPGYKHFPVVCRPFRAGWHGYVVGQGMNPVLWYVALTGLGGMGYVVGQGMDPVL